MERLHIEFYAKKLLKNKKNCWHLAKLLYRHTGRTDVHWFFLYVGCFIQGFYVVFSVKFVVIVCYFFQTQLFCIICLLRGSKCLVLFLKNIFFTIFFSYYKKQMDIEYSKSKKVLSFEKSIKNNKKVLLFSLLPTFYTTLNNLYLFSE